MRKHILFVLIIASLLLAACGGAAPVATPAPAATEAPAAAATEPAAADAGQPAGEVSLTTQPWQWIAFSGAEEQFTVETPESYQVTFNEDGTVNIVADCNNAAGTYTDAGRRTDHRCRPHDHGRLPGRIAQRPVCAAVEQRRQLFHG